MDRYSKQLMQLFGSLDLGSCVRISRLNWIGHVNRMDSTRKIGQVFNNNPQGSRLTGRRQKNGWRNLDASGSRSEIPGKV